ncbi:MAG TPA: hypothetical protein VGO86_15905 [Candidatus Dormibacteraeota bacterium]
MHPRLASELLDQGGRRGRPGQVFAAQRGNRPARLVQRVSSSPPRASPPRASR